VFYEHNNLLCYGGGNTIDWSYILPEDAIADSVLDVSNRSSCESESLKPWFRVKIKLF